MRKILMIVIIILLGVLGYTVVANGIEIGGFEVYSMTQIQEKYNELDDKIEEINTLASTTYSSKIQDLENASSNMKRAQSRYLEYTSLSSDEEILAAMQGKSYKIEFLWAKLGTHAKNEEINLKLEIASSSIGANNTNDLKFTIRGTYVNIINFVYAIENDSDLNFRISNFKLLPYDENGILEGTFTVSNITIEENKTTGTTTNTNTITNTVAPTTSTTSTTINSGVTEPTTATDSTDATEKTGTTQI